MNSSTSTSDRARSAWWLLPLLCVLLLPGYNWVQDYYGIFGQRSDWRGVIPNERYRKVEAVLERRDEITTLLFGSSKAANIPFYRTLGEGAYNIAYSEGLPRDHLQVLQLLADELPNLERVYIAVDEMGFLLDPSRHATDYLRRQHPAVAGLPGWRFALSYLFRPLSNIDALYFTPERQQRPHITYEFDSSGRSLCPSCDADIDADPETHGRQPFFRFPYNPPDRYGLERLRADLVAILELLASRDIEAVLFLQPTFANNLRWHNLGQLESLKAMLVELAPFHDFLVYDDALADTTNFYDVIHYRPLIGQRIIYSFADGENLAPGAFGFRVTADTLEAHNARIREQLLGKLVPVSKYQRDRAYSDWLEHNAFRRTALDGESAASVLAAAAGPVDCRIDSVNRGRFSGAPIRIPVEELGVLEFNGWARMSGTGSTGYLSIEELGLLGGKQVYAMAAAIPRPDVARRFGDEFAQVGFRGNLDISGLRRGNYRLSWRFQSEGAWFACSEDASLVIF